MGNNVLIIMSILFLLFYLNNSEQSLTEIQVIGRNCGVHVYVLIPISVRDGRDATLLLQVQLTIALLMGQHNDHENGDLNPRHQLSRWPLILSIFLILNLFKFYINLLVTG